MRAARYLPTVAAVALIILFTPAAGSLQEPPRLMSIAADSIDELRQWDPLVDRLTREGSLTGRLPYDDPQIPGRRHEALIQFHDGVPVHGADVMRQIDRGSTVSIFGTLYAGIDVDTTPRLTVDQAREALEATSGTTLANGQNPTLTILPMLDGSFALAYRASMLNTTTYFLDANDGRVLREISEIKHQGAVGRGRGALGDDKKISTTLIAGAYRTQDTLRPASIVTLDTRGSAASLNRLIQGGRWLESDVATDTDNDWTQSAVVDAHVHMGWVYDYFFKSHRYQGLNNRNAPVIGVVVSRALLPGNAFFVPPPFGPDGGGGMFFGEASSGPLTVLDVAAHELMHGVTSFAVMQRTGRQLGPTLPIDLGPTSINVGGVNRPCDVTTFAGFRFACSGGRYRMVSDHAGAINEGLSDVFGTAVEFAYQPAGTGVQRADYTMAEDFPEVGTLVRGRAGPLRSLQDPRALTIEGEPASGIGYPDHYTRRLSFALLSFPDGSLGISPVAVIEGAGYVVSDTDGEGLHWNSTILSHAFYLAIEGGQNRTSGRTVQGVGAANRTQIEQVFFRAVRDLFPSSLTFPQAAAILRQAAIDLHGASSAAFRAVDQALAAVGL